VPDLRKAIDNIQFRGEVRFDEPMSAHTSFKVGGGADVYLKPRSDTDISAIMSISEMFPVFVFGAGANILVADRGIRGIVVDMTGLDACTVCETTITAGAGAMVSDVAMLAARNSLSGIEFIYAMPGSVGGSVWMNARCYGKSISEILEFTEVVTGTGELRRVIPAAGEFSYKRSPFQKERWIIVRAGLKLERGRKETILEMMENHRRDREEKGHFAAPSAGSVFKNNRSFGMPTGKLIDSLALRGETVGGAQVSETHANIIINRGEATAGDIYRLIRLVEKRVFDAYGYTLEREVRLVGDWEEEADNER